MPGVRIHHPTMKNCTLLIPHPGDPKTGRAPKDYHIKLDSDGDCIVSETVLQRLLEARRSGLSLHDFVILNEVKDPPTQGVGFQEGTFRSPAMYKQVKDAIEAIAPPGIKVYVRPHKPGEVQEQ